MKYKVISLLMKLHIRNYTIPSTCVIKSLTVS